MKHLNNKNVKSIVKLYLAEPFWNHSGYDFAASLHTNAWLEADTPIQKVYIVSFLCTKI